MIKFDIFLSYTPKQPKSEIHQKMSMFELGPKKIRDLAFVCLQSKGQRIS